MYSSIAQKHTYAYLEPWHILIAKHIRTPRYIHNTILNIFTKALSWTFDTVLNASFFVSISIQNHFNVTIKAYPGIF